MFVSVYMKKIVMPGQPSCRVTLVESRVDPARRVQNCHVNSPRRANPGWYFHSNSHVCFYIITHHYSVRLDFVDFSHLYSPYFQVFVGRKADPGQSRGKADASAEW